MRCLTILLAALMVVCTTAEKNDDVIVNVKVLGGKSTKHVIKWKPHTLALSNNTSIAVLMEKIKQLEKQERNQTNEINKLTTTLSSLIEDLQKNISSLDKKQEKQERKQTNEINKLTNTLSSLIEDLKLNLSSQISAVIAGQKDKKAGSKYCTKKNACGRCHCKDDIRLKKKYFCDCRHVSPKRDCLDYLHSGYKTSGIYKIHERRFKNIDVYCDQKTDGGGWIVIQRRVDGSVSFYRNWKDYKTGFGWLQGNFWLGNDNIHALTQLHGSKIRFELEYWDGTRRYAKYENFQIGNEAAKYKLQISGYHGNAGDSMRHHNGQLFSTFDKDNDSYSGSCAGSFKGAWWYGNCHRVNLNGMYYNANVKYSYASGIQWHSIDGFKKSMKFAEMKIRRKK